MFNAHVDSWERSNRLNSARTIGTLSSLLPRLPTTIWISFVDPWGQPTNELSQNLRLVRTVSEPMLACEAEGGDYNASIGAAIGTYR